MKRLLFTLLLLCIPATALAGTATYSGNHIVPQGANLTFSGSGGGCLLVNSSGQAFVAACPIGTVAFSAAAPFTVTGSGPYVIGCATCFTTAGGTITGASTFSAATTFGSTASFAGNIGLHGISPNVNSTVPISFAAGDSMLGGNGQLELGATSGVVVQGVNGALFGLAQTSTGWRVAVDLTGNAGFAGQVTATQFNVLSKRAYKYDIQPLPFDALQVLHSADFKTFRYRPGHGDPRLPHVGIIADDSPSVLSGEKHDHLDIEALATVDAAAILQLDTQIKVLYLICLSLVVLVLTLGLGLGIALHEKTS